MATSTLLRIQRGIAPRLVASLVIALLAVPVVTAAPGGLIAAPLSLLRMTSPPAAIPAAGDAVEPPHNCRMYGAILTDMGVNGLYYDLVEAEDSLYNLSPANDDGWGIVFYPTPGTIHDPCDPNFRGPGIAMYDPDYVDRVEELNGQELYALLAHIRQGTTGCGGPNVPDPHPFFRDALNRTWSFEHNGTVSKTRLYNLIDPAYLAANPPNCSYLPMCQPCTEAAGNVVDSEVYFIWIMQNIEEHGGRVVPGVCAALNAMIQAGETGSMNFVMSDGLGLWAFRRGGTTYTLYYTYDRCDYARVASQMPDPNSSTWWAMDNYNLIDLVTREMVPDVRTYVPPLLLRDGAANAGLGGSTLTDNSLRTHSGETPDAVSQTQFAARSDDVGAVAAVARDPVDPSIHGFVTWPNGEPAANVRVSCLKEDCSYAASTLSGANGYYYLDGLPAGSYVVRARCRANCTTYGAEACHVHFDGCNPVIVDLPLRTVWRPCPDIACSKGDALFEPAEPDGTRGPGSTGSALVVGIGGVVYWECGLPPEAAAYVTVTAKRICAPDIYTAVSDGKGNYFIKLPAGKYNVTAQIRVDGVTFTGLACEVAVDGTGLVTRDLTLLKKLPYACMDCTPTPN